MPNYQAQRYAQLLRDNPTVRRFLNLIGWAEGADYNTGYAQRQISDLSRFPYQACAFNRNGSVNTSGRCSNTTTSAAGKYQFQADTWREAATALGLTDFSAQSQDLAALYLIDQKRGALPDVVSGSVTSAVRKLQNEWESFKTRPIDSIVGKWNGIGGSTSAPTQPITNGAQWQQSSADRFAPYFGAKVVTTRQRYMLAFALLLLIFIFAFAT